MTDEIMKYSGAVQEFKRNGGILDGGKIAKFRRLKREQAENKENDAVNRSH